MLKVLSHEQIAVAATAVGLTLPSTTAVVKAIVKNSLDNHVRWQSGASAAPTTSVGQLLFTSEELEVEGDDLSNIRFIRDGSVSATLDVTYFTDD